MIRILPTMVNFIKKEPENFISIEGVFGSMYIDTESSPELMAEGFAREVVRRVQEMRKEVDMDVEDYLKTQIKARGEVLDMLKKWREFIAFETRSRSLDFNEEEINEEYMVEWQIEKETIGIGITPLYIKEAIESYTKIPGMTPKKAIALYDADYKTLHQLDKATKTDLLKVRGIGEADARHIREFFEKPEDQRFKKVNHCPFCGVELPPRATKCPRCDELVREDIKICKNCGREVPMKTEHCYYCGAHPDKEKAVAPKVAPEKAVVAEAAAGTEEELETPAEAKPAQEAKVRELPDLFDSSIYLLKESKAENSYKLFIRYIKEGKKGFCATRVYPGKIKSHYKLEKVPIIWLSNVAKDESIRPKDLEKLSYSIERHISEGNAIVLLEGLEYLITNNNFITVLRLIQALRDQVAMHSAILVMPINPVAIDPHQMNLLEKEVDSTLDFT